MRSHPSTTDSSQSADALGAIAPMLAGAGSLPTGVGWRYEFKWDGLRGLCHLDGTTVKVFSRNGRDITTGFPELAELTALLDGRRAVLDGEIIALEDGGRPSFALLQRRMHVQSPSAALLADVPVRFYVFDLLRLDDESTIALPYEQRRQLLEELPLAGEVVRVPPSFDDGPRARAAAAAYGLEGVVAKRLGSPYRPGKRSIEWTKVPFVQTQEVVVVGYRLGEGRRAGTIGSLLVAVQDSAGVLRFAGHVGTGFSDADLRHLQHTMAPLCRPTPPLSDVPREYARHATWVDPVLVGDVAFRNWTPDHRLRHPSWRGDRPDRSPREVRRPTPPPAVPTATVTASMRTTDGRWRVEVVQAGSSQWYRIVRGDSVFDWLDISDVERILRAADLDLADLVEVEPAA